MSKGPRFGSHLSAAGGMENAVLAARELGFESAALFVKNQRQWAGKPLTPEQIAAYRRAAQSTGVHPVVAHASYLINLASEKDDLRDKSMAALADEVARCDALGIPFIVLHPGAAGPQPVNIALHRIAGAINSVLEKVQGGTSVVLLESMAGQGTTLGHEPEHLTTIIAGVKPKARIGVCLDTCHLFAAGSDFRTAEGYAALMAKLDAAFGLNLVRCIHLNDSQVPCGKRVDRHDHIGQGHIGLEGFAHFVNDPRWNELPMILETPKGTNDDGEDLDAINLRTLKELQKPAKGSKAKKTRPS